MGNPHTEAAKITERFKRTNFGSLTLDVTIDDPKAYTKPFTVRFNQRLAPSDELIEFICNENERSAAHLLGKTDSPPPSAAYTIDPKLLDRYVGRYQMAPGSFVVITKSGSQLFGQIGDLPPFELFASSERDFFLKAFDSRFTFEVDAKGRAAALIMHGDTDRRAARAE